MSMNESLQGYTPTKDVHWPSVWQLVLSSVACAVLFLVALSYILLALWDVLMLGVSIREVTSTILMSSSLVFSALLVFPSAAYAFSRLTSRSINLPGERFLRALKPGYLMLMFPVLVILGNFLTNVDELVWLLLPPLHIVVIGGPIYWLISIAIRKLPQFSPQRQWGVFGSGLILGPMLIMVFEIGALFLILIGLSVIMVYQPDLGDYIFSLAERVQRVAPTVENMTRILAPLLTRPSIIYLLLAFTAVIVPLIEEMIKPIGVWLLIGRRLNPMEGFIAGCLSGAAYALFENLSFSSNLDGWTTLVVARIGTSVMHIATSGLMGWGMATAWKEGRYLKLGLAYFIAVLFHGLWNGLTIMTAITAISMLAQIEQSALMKIGFTAPFGILLLIVITFLFLIRSNKVLRKTLNTQHIHGIDFDIE